LSSRSIREVVVEVLVKDCGDSDNQDIDDCLAIGKKKGFLDWPLYRYVSAGDSLNYAIHQPPLTIGPRTWKLTGPRIGRRLASLGLDHLLPCERPSMPSQLALLGGRPVRER